MTWWQEVQGRSSEERGTPICSFGRSLGTVVLHKPRRQPVQSADIFGFSEALLTRVVTGL